jgi:hypothetical protein
MSLITLAEYKTITGVTVATYDAYVTAIIPYIQSSIEEYCDRLFDTRTNYEWSKYQNDRTVVVQQYPITDIIMVGNPVQVANTSFPTTSDYNIEIKSDRVTVTDMNDPNFAQDSYLFSANNTLADLKANIEGDYPLITVAITTGYTTMVCKLLRTGTGSYWTGAQRIFCQTRVPDLDQRIIEFAEDSGISFSYTLDFYFNENIEIIYKSGYATADVPKALKTACAMMINDMIKWTEKLTLGIYKSESVTNYSYTLADGIYIKDLIKTYSAQLNPFKKKIVG